MARTTTVHRTTAETDIRLALDLDGRGEAAISTGIGFLDHMLTLFARHACIDLTVQARGDLHVDQHHTVEDVGICLGTVLRQALGDKAGIRRYGDVTLPMDESLVTVAIVDEAGGVPPVVVAEQLEVAGHHPHGVRGVDGDLDERDERDPIHPFRHPSSAVFAVPATAGA